MTVGRHGDRGVGDPILVVGSGTLVRALLPEGSVDELRLMLFPVSIGDGMRVFGEERIKLPWTLTDHRTFPTGVMVLTYEPA